MPTKSKGSAAEAKSQDAITMLTADHKKVKKLFSDFDKLKQNGSDEEKSAVVEQICNELTIHAELEEEIFYPAVREAIDEGDLMDEALVEHAGAKDLIAQLQDMDPEDDLYDAKVTVLGEQINHHVGEEEGEMFPKAKKSGVDTEALANQMLQRKTALMKEMGINGAAEDGEEEQEDSAGNQGTRKRAGSGAKAR
ncbi:MAG: hemerythrin domain-containing protein [Pseudomonadota bacterium]|nr:hemerythrin domain-containing protein [Pseudomonadota bacterium]